MHEAAASIEAAIANGGGASANAIATLKAAVRELADALPVLEGEHGELSGGVFQAAAALYGVAATKLAVVNQPWVLVEADDELTLELPTNCVWDDNEQLCELADKFGFDMAMVKVRDEENGDPPAQEPGTP